ncbi:MAG: hypothetical protein DSY90_03075 [Deltaproteobacteria bacterium]|nr:MAG: hypothetical protein DSY90_03075 [Deltaproteobacteria bacterium]
MVISEKKWTPNPLIVKSALPAGIQGGMSPGAAVVLLAVCIVAGFIFYRLFSVNGNVQTSLDGPSGAVTEPIRYKIVRPPSVTAGEKGRMKQSLSEESLPPIQNDEKQSETAVETSAVAEFKGKGVSQSVDTTASPSHGGNPKDAAPVPDAKADSQSDIQADTTSGIQPVDGQPAGLSAEQPKGEGRPASFKKEPARERESLFTKVPAGRVRKAPSMDADILFYLKKGDKVSVIDTRDGWYRIDTADGQRGWANGMLFSIDAPGHLDKADKNLIRAVLVESPEPNRQTVHIVLSDYHLPNTMILKGDRPRVVCDFYGLHISPGMKKRVEYETGLVRAVRTGIHAGEKPKIRIVVDLVPGRDYIIEKSFILEENVFLVDIRLK